MARPWHRRLLPAELMMCLRICRVPTRSLSLLVSSLGSKKASRRSGEQQAAGRHAHQILSKSLFAPCLHPKLTRTESVHGCHSVTRAWQDREAKLTVGSAGDSTSWPSISPGLL